MKYGIIQKQQVQSSLANNQTSLITNLMNIADLIGIDSNNNIINNNNNLARSLMNQNLPNNNNNIQLPNMMSNHNFTRMNKNNNVPNLNFAGNSNKNNVPNGLAPLLQMILNGRQ